jgi:Putative bacterial sensory transduction regulator
MGDERAGGSAAIRRAFLCQQVATLAAYGSLVVGVDGPPHDALRIERDEDGAWGLSVWNRADPPFSPSQREGLARLGFVEAGALWQAPTVDGAAPETWVGLAEAVLVDVFGAGSDEALNLRHESTRDQREAQRRLTAMREVIEPVLTDLLGGPPERDDDGDYVVAHDSARVFVSPQALPGRPAIVGVFAITNVGVNATSELGAFLAEVNFRLIFGRFSIDIENRAVWLTENLLGEHLDPADLRLIVEAVAETADAYDQRIAERWGGQTARAAHNPDNDSPAKPGSMAGYL